jgi:hypothetical protein
MVSHEDAEPVETINSSRREPVVEEDGSVCAGEVIGALTSPLPIPLISAHHLISSSGTRAIQRDSNRLLKVDGLSLQDQVGEESEDASIGCIRDRSKRVTKVGHTQLTPGRKYIVRPAPLAGYGVYDGNSLIQLHAEEDDARDAVDAVMGVTQ